YLLMLSHSQHSRTYDNSVTQALTLSLANETRVISKPRLTTRFAGRGCSGALPVVSLTLFTLWSRTITTLLARPLPTDPDSQNNHLPRLRKYATVTTTRRSSGTIPYPPYSGSFLKSLRVTLDPNHTNDPEPAYLELKDAQLWSLLRKSLKDKSKKLVSAKITMAIDYISKNSMLVPSVYEASWELLILCKENGLEAEFMSLCKMYNSALQEKYLESQVPDCDLRPFKNYTERELLLLAYTKLKRLESIRGILRVVIDQREVISPDVYCEIVDFVLRMKRTRSGTQMMLALYNRLAENPEYVMSVDMIVRVIWLRFYTNNIKKAMELYNNAMANKSSPHFLSDPKDRQQVIEITIKGLLKRERRKDAVELVNKNSVDATSLHACYKAFIYGLSIQNAIIPLQRTIGFLERHTNPKMKPTAEMYSAYLNVLAYYGRAKEIISILERIISEKRVLLTDWIFSSIIIRLAKWKSVDACQRVYELSIRPDEQLSKKMILAILTLFNYTGNVRQVLRIFNAIISNEWRTAKDQQRKQQQNLYGKHNKADTSERLKIDSLENQIYLLGTSVRRDPIFLQSAANIVFGALANNGSEKELLDILGKIRKHENGDDADVQTNVGNPEKHEDMMMYNTDVYIRFTPTNYFNLFKAFSLLNCLERHGDYLKQVAEKDGIQTDPQTNQKIFRLCLSSITKSYKQSVDHY
ncbi:hypothetical protein H4219_006374, partial [Mycoemilia scoparia]